MKKFILIAFIFLFLVNVSYSEYSGKWILLRENVVTNGVTYIESDDGEISVTNIGGKECFATGKNGDDFIYFAVNDSYIFNLNDASDGIVFVDIGYYDIGTNRFYIEYDSFDGNYESSPMKIVKSDSREWKVARFILPDAKFSNRESNGADFRINDNSDGKEYISYIRVVKYSIDEYKNECIWTYDDSYTNLTPIINSGVSNVTISNSENVYITSPDSCKITFRFTCTNGTSYANFLGFQRADWNSYLIPGADYNKLNRWAFFIYYNEPDRGILGRWESFYDNSGEKFYSPPTEDYFYLNFSGWRLFVMDKSDFRYSTGGDGNGIVNPPFYLNYMFILRPITGDVYTSYPTVIQTAYFDCFHFVKDGDWTVNFGSLYGKVLYINGDIVSDAINEFCLTDGVQKAIVSSNGSYFFDYIPLGNYKISLTNNNYIFYKHNDASYNYFYIDGVGKNITITSFNRNITNNITLYKILSIPDISYPVKPEFNIKKLSYNEIPSGFSSYQYINGFQITPLSGTPDKFSEPVTISIFYTNSDIEAEKYKIYAYNDGAWIDIGGLLNKEKKSIEVKMNEICNIYALIDTSAISDNNLNEFEWNKKVFTPNGDGQNDNIYINLNCNELTKVVVEIYDLQGNRVREVFNDEIIGAYTIFWNGESDYGRILPVGPYIYQIKVGNSMIKTGIILLTK